jgi:hypothetical protein
MPILSWRIALKFWILRHTYRKPLQTSSWDYTFILGFVLQLAEEFEPLVIIFIRRHDRNDVVKDAYQSEALVKIGNGDQVLTRIAEPQPKERKECEHGRCDDSANDLSLLQRIRVITNMENREKQADQSCDDGEGGRGDDDDFVECPGAGDRFCLIVFLGKRITNGGRGVMMEDAYNSEICRVRLWTRSVQKDFLQLIVESEGA